MFRSTSKPLIAAAAIAAATAIAACGSSSPSNPTPSVSGGHPSQVQMQEDAVRFADCVRSHGVPNFPDPETSGRIFKIALSDESPAVKSAESACLHLLPGGGPPSQSQAHSPAQIAGMLAFVSCLRSHGLQSFPDPTSSGELTHEMVANAGINLHQPAVLQIGDACVSASHGVVTKAMVARFVAGQ